MLSTRNPERSASRASAALLLLAGALATGGCEAVYGVNGPVASRAKKELSNAPSAPQKAVVSIASTGGAVEVRPYDGDRSDDERLESLVRELTRVADDAAAVAASEAGLSFTEGRGPLVVLGDDDVPRRGDVAVRLIDGVRRPVLRVPVTGLLSGTFLPAAHFAPMVIEAAVLSTAGDRTPPPWLTNGLAVELSGSFDRLLHERALGGPTLRVSANSLFPVDDIEDPLVAATRVRALERIARGDRPLARFVKERLSGAGEAAALDAVGVQGDVFLEAAAETERAEALDDLALGGPLGALAEARDALASDSPEGAALAAPVLKAALRDGDANEYVAAEARIVLAHVAFLRNDLKGAARHLQSASTPADALLRPAEARLLAARVTEAAGEAEQSSRLYRAFAADFPDHPAASQALLAVGISEEVAASAPGVASDVVSKDARVRARAAVALGEAGDPSAAPALREMIDDDDPDVRRLSLAALALLLGEDAENDLERGTRDGDAAVRGAALSMLAFASPARGESRARDLATDDNAEVRTAAERILASAAPPKTQPVPKTAASGAARPAVAGNMRPKPPTPRPPTSRGAPLPPKNTSSVTPPAKTGAKPPAPPLPPPSSR